MLYMYLANGRDIREAFYKKDGTPEILNSEAAAPTPIVA